MPVSAKICGLSTPETLDAAIKGGASHVGFVFHAKSPRNVSPDRAASLASRVPAHVRKVGVFASPSRELIDQVLASVPLDVLQIHGLGTPQELRAVGEGRPIELWQAIAIRTRADLSPATSFAGVADRLLFDAKTGDPDMPGGMGVRFDWSLLSGFRHATPWALSGGLHLGNIGEAVKATGATLVDVSSGVESSPGIKKVDKIAAFLKAVASL